MVIIVRACVVRAGEKFLDYVCGFALQNAASKTVLLSQESIVTSDFSNSSVCICEKDENDALFFSSTSTFSHYVAGEDIYERTIHAKEV